MFFRLKDNASCTLNTRTSHIPERSTQTGMYRKIHIALFKMVTRIK